MDLRLADAQGTFDLANNRTYQRRSSSHRTVRRAEGEAMTDINPTALAQTHSTPSAASALVGDPSRFGRVAEDGTVFVRTNAGEKPVGSYPVSYTHLTLPTILLV